MKISDNWILQTIWWPKIKKSIEFNSSSICFGRIHGRRSNDCNSAFNLIPLATWLCEKNRSHFSNVRFSISMSEFFSLSLVTNFANLPFNNNQPAGHSTVQEAFNLNFREIPEKKVDYHKHGVRAPTKETIKSDMNTNGINKHNSSNFVLFFETEKWRKKIVQFTTIQSISQQHILGTRKRQMNDKKRLLEKNRKYPIVRENWKLVKSSLLCVCLTQKY